MWSKLYYWIGILAPLVVLPRAISRLYRFGFSWPRLIWVIILPALAVASYWAMRRSEKDEDDESDGLPDHEPLISIVLMLREVRFLDAAILARMASKAWDVEVTSGDQDDQGEDECFAIGESPMLILRGPDGMFLVHNHPEPYTEPVDEAAATIQELRLREAFKLHRSWMAVDLLGEPFTDLVAAYRAIGRLVAALADEDCLLLYGTESKKMVIYSPELDELLRGEEPLAALNYFPNPPVIDIAGDHPEMKAAVAEAQRRWPEFVAAFESREPDQMYSVKAELSDGEHSEFIWIHVTAMEDDRIIGRLGNVPVTLRGLKEGEIVKTTVRALNDWMYMREGQEPVGGFTVEVLRRHMQSKRSGPS